MIKSWLICLKGMVKGCTIRWFCWQVWFELILCRADTVQISPLEAHSNLCSPPPCNISPSISNRSRCEHTLPWTVPDWARSACRIVYARCNIYCLQDYRKDGWDGQPYSVSFIFILSFCIYFTDLEQLKRFKALPRFTSLSFKAPSSDSSKTLILSNHIAN